MQKYLPLRFILIILVGKLCSASLEHPASWKQASPRQVQLRSSPSCSNLNDASCWPMSTSSRIHYVNNEMPVEKQHRLQRREFSGHFGRYQKLHHLSRPTETLFANKNRNKFAHIRPGVILASDDKRETVVLKYLPLRSRSNMPTNPDDINRFGHEIKMHSLASEINHPCIINMLDHFRTPETINLVMQWADGGSLEYRLMERANHDTNAASEKEEDVKRPIISEVEMIHIFYQMASVLFHIHEVLPLDQQFAHRDFKLSNIGIYLPKHAKPSTTMPILDFTETRVALFDFEFAQHRRPTGPQAYTRLFDYCGTPEYVPEDFVNKRGRIYNLSALDVWAFGIALLAVIVEELPEANRMQQVSPPPLPTKRERKQYQGVSDELWSLLDMVLAPVNDQRRVSIRDVLEHAFFRDCDDENKYRKGTISHTLCVKDRVLLKETSSVPVVTQQEMIKLNPDVPLFAAPSSSSSSSSHDHGEGISPRQWLSTWKSKIQEKRAWWKSKTTLTKSDGKKPSPSQKSPPNV